MPKVDPTEKKIESDVETIIDEGRVVNFSDAVFAFSATLLVLKIDLPTLTRQGVELQLTQSLATLWPQYFANIISFLIIGYFWLCHHAIFGQMRRFNNTVVWINLIFLISLSFLPFPVDLYGDFPQVPLVVVFYCASLAITGYLLALIWWYASHNNKLVDSKMSKRRGEYYMARNLVAPIVFTLSIPLVYIHPFLAQASWIFIILGVLGVNRWYKYKGMSELAKMSV